MRTQQADQSGRSVGLCGECKMPVTCGNGFLADKHYHNAIDAFGFPTKKKVCRGCYRPTVPYKA